MELTNNPKLLCKFESSIINDYQEFINHFILTKVKQRLKYYDIAFQTGLILVWEAYKTFKHSRLVKLHTWITDYLNYQFSMRFYNDTHCLARRAENITKRNNLYNNMVELNEFVPEHFLFDSSLTTGEDIKYWVSEQPIPDTAKDYLYAICDGYTDKEFCEEINITQHFLIKIKNNIKEIIKNPKK